ncbi:short-chain dehydrogenase [Eremomyces bilateralis CBS 781.70]|uniref:Short-chain dehydrogenase n=1 Tax=Eremomyces bilateralis CBS 781.70 TaxID=1392243 RepID=A0A6G1FSM7_9PEZI|nr:short-chain dehydrogenase [Eremomyces bilateralis CBS 781.70]KAF1808682.1 short-chain dehydrogenase [Eremomyces bilateralis CBS 781.70]
MRAFLDQSYCIPNPTFTLKDLPDQSDKVHIVTGGYGGVGLELVQLLVQRNATVYIAGRTQSKYDAALPSLRAAFPASTSRIEFLPLDLADLPSIPAAANRFLAAESRLDVLTNNAGVMVPPRGSVTAQDYELQMGTNCLGPYLFTQCLLPLLQRTAATAPRHSVRVTWAASIVIEQAPTGGIAWNAATGGPTVLGGLNGVRRNYAQSKAGNVMLATEFARRYGKDGIVSVSWNPGNLASELMRDVPSVARWLARWVFLHPVRLGAFTELFAGWSPEIGEGRNGAHVIPWGRLGGYREDLVRATRDGTAERFVEWCERETSKYAKVKL